MLAGVILAAMASLLAPEIVPTSRSDLECAGGAHIFFEVGSDKIDEENAERLDGFATYWRGATPPGILQIESGGDGMGTAFDSELSLRRSSTIKAFLVGRGHRPENIVVLSGEVYDHPKESGELRLAIQRIGSIVRLISREDYARLYPPDLILECF
jgi:hypothetical protein